MQNWRICKSISKVLTPMITRVAVNALTLLSLHMQETTTTSIFVRDRLCQLLRSTYEELRDNPLLVISTHYSKSVKLPVFQINLEKYGIEMVLRYNFYDWKISVKSDKPLDFDYMGLFNPTEEISYLYCEGFPRDKVYGSYEQSHSQFTIEIGSHYDLYTFIFLLKNYLGIKRED